MNFHPLAVMGRGSETQLQVGEFFNSALLGLLVGEFFPVINFAQNMFDDEAY